jgi:hypothetical protein
MALVVEVELRIMGSSRHDPSILIESSRRLTAAPNLDPEIPDAERVAEELANAAMEMSDVVPAALSDALDQVARLTGRVRSEFGIGEAS